MALFEAGSSLPLGPSKRRFKKAISALQKDKENLIREMDDLRGRVQFLINFLHQKGILEEGVFCFPDGDIWEATQQQSSKAEPSPQGDGDPREMDEHD